MEQPAWNGRESDWWGLESQLDDTPNLRSTNGRENYMETSLRFLEKNRLREMKRFLSDKNIKVTGFYHTSKQNIYWESVISEQLRLMDGSRVKSYAGTLNNNNWDSKYWASVLEISDFLHLTVAGSDSDYEEISRAVTNLNLRNSEKLKIYHTHTMDVDKYRFASEDKKKELRTLAIKNNLTEGEYYTITALHNYCKKQRLKNEKTFVYYAHNVGDCCPRGSNFPVADWRDEMNAFNLEFPSTCLRALLSGYSACGVEYQEALYSGTFWWADCDHVAALPGLWDPINNAHDVGDFVFNISTDRDVRKRYAEYCGYSMFHCHVNHYTTRCPRSTFIKNVGNLLLSDTLPPNSAVSRRSLSNEWVKQKCTAIYKRPYMEQPAWRGKDATWWR